MDNGRSHHPSTSPARIHAQFLQVTTIHLPTHSSWLNQVELYFSIVHRKALTPANLPSVAALEARLCQFQYAYNQPAEPFRWQYTRAPGSHRTVRRAAAQLQDRREAMTLPAHCLTN